MPEDLEYIVNGAYTMCDKGIAVLPLMTSINTSVKVQNQLVATELDKVPLINIPSYGMCSITQSPCTAVPTIWQNAYPFVKVKGLQTLTFKSCMFCGLGGKIEFITSGQLPLSQCIDEESLKAIEQANQLAKEAVEEYKLEQDSVGEAGIAESFIPVWGSGRDAIHSFQTGHWGWGIFHSAMVIVDVVTLGGGTVVKGTAKAGVKGGLKALGKAAGKKLAAALAAKTVAVNLIKSSLKAFNKLSIKYIGVCIAKACFPAGTPVATADGLKNIEDIKIGDRVWAYDEISGTIGVKPVLNTVRKKNQSMVKLTIDGEEIQATPEHPFFANGEWKEAGLLETNDSILLFSGKLAKVESVETVLERTDASNIHDIALPYEDYLLPQPNSKENHVFNFEVAEFHTYFVGNNKMLVHNAPICIKTAVKVFRRNMKERAKALLRDAADMTNGLSKKARDFIKRYKGERVPPGYEVSHEIPLYTGKNVAEKEALDVAKNMRTQAKKAHRARHKVCGDQYHAFPR